MKMPKLAESGAEGADPKCRKLCKTKDESRVALSGREGNRPARRHPRDSKGNPKRARFWIGNDKPIRISVTGKDSSSQRKLCGGNSRPEATLSGTVADVSGLELPRVAIADSGLSSLTLKVLTQQLSPLLYVHVSGFCVYKYGLP